MYEIEMCIPYSMKFAMRWLANKRLSMVLVKFTFTNGLMGCLMHNSIQ